MSLTDKFLVNDRLNEIILKVITACKSCGDKNINLLCSNHVVTIDDISIKIRSLPWSIKNKILSRSITFDKSGAPSYDADHYLRECLKYMVCEAPWGVTNDIFLLRVGDELGAALQMIVPAAFNTASDLGINEIKKELGDS